METNAPSNASDRDTYRNVASDWHGGQASALYAYSSTGTVVPGLCAEIRDCIRMAPEGAPSKVAAAREQDKLRAFHAYVAPMEATITPNAI